MTEIDAELARLREACTKAFIVAFMDEGGCYLGDISAKTLLALIDALEKAWSERDDARKKRDSARALLLKIRGWLERRSYSVAEIDAELEPKP